VNPMTDKLSSSSCTYYANGTGTCFSVYHTCARIKITGFACTLCPPKQIQSNTRVLFRKQDPLQWAAQYQSTGYRAPSGWSYGGTQYVYNKGEKSAWSTAGYLTGQSATAVGPCASVGTITTRAKHDPTF
jgi:hypothetical protein